MRTELRYEPPIYAECPACQLVTAPVWQARDGAGPGGWPAAVGCGYCGHEHRVTRAAAYAARALVRHEACGATVAGPAEAHLVRCQGHDRGCGDLFPGPAA
jgi:hypothetical protein